MPALLTSLPTLPTLPTIFLAGLKRYLWLTVLSLLGLLSACGGSGSAPGSTNGIPVTGNPATGNPSLVLVLIGSDGKASTNGALLSLDAALTAQATFLDSTGAPIANSRVSFSSSSFASLQPTNGSVLTNANGIATVKVLLNAESSSQVGAAGSISANAITNSSLDPKTASATSRFQIGASSTPPTSTNIAKMSLVLVDAKGRGSANGALLSADGPITAQATVLDDAGNPVPNNVVQFSLSGSLGLLQPAFGQVLTDASGIASVQIRVKDEQTAQIGAIDFLNVSTVVATKSLTAKSTFQIGPNISANSVNLSISLQDSNGSTSRIASLDSPLTALVKVLDAQQQPLANSIVNISANTSLVIISPATGNVLTNSLGVASVTILPKDLLTAQTQSGAADAIKASFALNGKAYTSSAIYQIGSSQSNTASASLSLSLVNAAGQSATSTSSSNPLIAKAKVLDAKGLPIANALVSFATSGLFTILSPASGATLTNAQGIASISIVPKDLSIALTQSGAADSIKATTTIGSNPLISSANFQLGATGVSLALVEPVGGTVNLNAYDTTFLKFDVLVNGAPYTTDPVVLNFSSGCASTGRASLPATATTTNGRAQIAYTDNGCGGTDIVNATFTGAPTVSAKLVVAAPVASSLSFVEASPADKAIVIKGAGGTGRSETAALTFIAFDTTGKPLQNQLVNFAVNSTQPVSLQTTSAITNSQGKVTANVNSGTQPTTFRVIASFASNPSISTVSGVVTVSNGTPTQGAFSLSQGVANIEGWNVDNVTNSVTILLADAFGNPVADGTPVVFQTDSGAIGSSNNGGCATSNGACSVIFRSQNPRFLPGNSQQKRAGLATITATSSTALINISGQIATFLSGSFATNLFPSGGNTAYTSTANTLSNSSCGTYSLLVEVNDENFNPMPAGTKLSVTNLSPDITVGTIIPATVPSIGPHDSTGAYTLVVANMAQRQGSVHTIPITLPLTCITTGAITKTATFTLNIASPLAKEVNYPFSLPYPSN